jgi:hypothetical protein
MSSNDSSLAVAIVAIGLLGLMCLWSPINGGDLPLGYPNEVTGTILNDPGVRYVRGGDSGQEKVSLTIGMAKNPGGTLGVGWYKGSLVVECLSTRCTQILQGESHTFACRGDGRALEPNVVVCKHVRQNDTPEPVQK